MEAAVGTGPEAPPARPASRPEPRGATPSGRLLTGRRVTTAPSDTGAPTRLARTGLRAQAHRHAHPHPAPASFPGHAGADGRPGRAGGTHLQVPVDDPHLVAVEHRLQDLLDAVAVADSARVSAVARGLRGMGVGPQPGGAQGRQRIKAPSATREQTLAGGAPHPRPARAWLGLVLLPPPCPAPLVTPTGNTLLPERPPRGPRWPRLTPRRAGGWCGRERPVPTLRPPVAPCQSSWNLSAHSGRRLPTGQLGNPGGGSLAAQGVAGRRETPGLSPNTTSGFATCPARETQRPLGLCTRGLVP